jgi:epsilon-lactone hydrolase
LIDQPRQSGFQTRRVPGARRAVYYCALLALWALCLVSLRRLFKGPRHPGWDFRYELLATAVRVVQTSIMHMPMARMRLHTLPTRVHPSVREQLEHELGSLAGLYAESFAPRELGPEAPVVLYFHGGGYVSCSPATHRNLLSRIALASGARCIAVDYRKAPEYPFPVPIDDCEAAYRALLGEGVPPARVVLAGDSAGGALVLAVLQRVRDARLPLPAAAVLISPWVDLTYSGESVQGNAVYDYLTPAALALGAHHYLQGQDPRHPLASPMYADLRGLPPLLLLTGSAELFFSENHTLAARARAHGVELTHHVEQGMVHVSTLFAGLVPHAARGVDVIGAFVRALEARPAARPVPAHSAPG